MKNPNFLVDHKERIFKNILHFLINGILYYIRGSTSRGQPVFVSCPDIKQAKKTKVITIKKPQEMKTIFASIVFMMLGVVSWSQNATINGNYCSTAPACPMYVCQGSSTMITAGVTSGSIDSLKLRERYSDNGGTSWSTWSLVGTSTITTVPLGGSAVAGRIYQYWLRVYQTGSERWAFSQMYVNAAPIATLLSNYTTICAGTTVTLTASDGGVGSTYNFKINGASAQDSTISNFASSTLANGDTVTVTITNIGGCSSTSNGITMTVHPNPQATTIVSNLSTPGACPGSLVPVTITGLTGTGPWHLEVWNTVGGIPTSLHVDVGTTNNPNPTINVPVYNVGQNPMFLKVSDAFGCHN